MLHGRSPFKGRNYKEVSDKVLKGDIDFDSTVNPDLASLIREILQSDPKKRPDIDYIINYVGKIKEQGPEACFRPSKEPQALKSSRTKEASTEVSNSEHNNQKLNLDHQKFQQIRAILDNMKVMKESAIRLNIKSSFHSPTNTFSKKHTLTKDELGAVDRPDRKVAPISKDNKSRGRIGVGFTSSERQRVGSSTKKPHKKTWSPTGLPSKELVKQNSRETIVLRGSKKISEKLKTEANAKEMGKKNSLSSPKRSFGSGKLVTEVGEAKEEKRNEVVKFDPRIGDLKSNEINICHLPVQNQKISAKQSEGTFLSELFYSNSGKPVAPKPSHRSLKEGENVKINQVLKDAPKKLFSQTKTISPNIVCQMNLKFGENSNGKLVAGEKRDPVRIVSPKGTGFSASSRELYKPKAKSFKFTVNPSNPNADLHSNNQKKK